MGERGGGLWSCGACRGGRLRSFVEYDGLIDVVCGRLLGPFVHDDGGLGLLGGDRVPECRDGHGGLVIRFSSDGLVGRLLGGLPAHESVEVLRGHGAVVGSGALVLLLALPRSEDRRVGKELVSTCRSRGWPYH